MTLVPRQICGFNNATAMLSIVYDDSFSPPEIVEVRLTNQGPGATFNVHLLSRVNRSVVRTFSHPEKSGADQVLNRAGIVAIFGDLRMLDVVSPKNGSHGWDLPWFTQCWSS